MHSDQPSTTAFLTAAARAAHLIVDDEPRILVDDVAIGLLGDRAEEFLVYQRDHGSLPVMRYARADVVCRTRWVEDVLAEAVRDGVEQYVLLAAGLDSFAHRNPLAARVRTFEVDHPATQGWKTRRLREAGIAALGELVHVPADLEHDDPLERLAGVGLDVSRPAVVSWMGCTLYLTVDAIAATLASLARLAPGSQVLFDCLDPAASRHDPSERRRTEGLSSAMASFGEPWRSMLGREDVDALLAKAGLDRVAYAATRDGVPAALWERADGLAPSPTAWLARAVVPAR